MENNSRRIELNGVANILALIEMNISKNTSTGLKEVNLYGEEVVALLNQLDLLERYMLAYNDAILKQVQTPFWHEVKQNPNLYKTNRERFK